MKKIALQKIFAILVVIAASVGLFAFFFGSLIKESYSEKVCTTKTNAVIVGFRYDPLQVKLEYIQLQCEYYVDGQKYVEYESGTRHNGLGFFSANMDQFQGREISIKYNPERHSQFVIDSLYENPRQE